MPITTVSSDASALTLTVVGDYPVPVERLWQAYADPRQLERFWGPETYPATFTRHEVEAGGRSAYSMTGPEGDTSRGWWRFLAVEPGRGFEVEDGFANEDGTPNDNMPSMRMVFRFEPAEQLTRARDPLRVAADDALAALRLLGHQPRAFQHGDVLLHRREGHLVPGRERGDRRLLSGQQTRDDVPPRRIGEGVEDAVDLRIAERITYNHMVVYRAGMHGAQASRGAMRRRARRAGHPAQAAGPGASGGGSRFLSASALMVCWYCAAGTLRR